MCDQIEEIRGLGAELVIIGNGSVQQAQWFAEDQQLDVATLYTDPELSVYRALGARRSLLRVLHPGTLVSAFRAMRSGHRQTKVMGDATQLGGTLVVQSDGVMPYRRLSRYPGDHPDTSEVLAVLRRIGQPG